MSNKAAVYFKRKWREKESSEDVFDELEEYVPDPFIVDGEVAVNFERDFVVVSEETDEYQLVQHFIQKHDVEKIEFSMNKKNSALVTPMKKKDSKNGE
jgi:hypothetical protein